ncbi:MAG: DsbA family protein [Sulfurovum sp.]|nr:DsbA family protein [Sulfurovum sp.]
MSTSKTQLIFIVDPMCSWCWGFHPVIEKLCLNHAERYTFSLVVGGLRTSGQMQWNTQNKSYLKQNWDAVQQKTSQPFNPKLLNLTYFDYDTYPACKAIVTVRELWGEDTAFEYLAAIQSAFYTQGTDITSLDILTSYITKDKKAFTTFYTSQRAEQLMQHDFSKARSMGANAFPSTVKIDNEGHMICLSGYRPLEEILKV